MNFCFRFNSIQFNSIQIHKILKALDYLDMYYTPSRSVVFTLFFFLFDSLALQSLPY